MSFALERFFPDASRLILGTMHLGGSWDQQALSTENINEAFDIVSTALEQGINVIDCADIYTHSKAEQTLGELFKRERSLRQHLIVQSKIGIRLCPQVNVKQYDLSSAWIQESVNASIKRLHDNPLDILFLHRPDPLMDLNDTAKALNQLFQQGKYSYLAVSNMHAGQIAYLQSALDAPIIANQLEMSLVKHEFVSEGITTNMAENASSGFPRGTLEFCLQSNIQLQAWSPIAQGSLSQDNHNEKYLAQTHKILVELSSEYNCDINTIVLAWLLKHPAKIQPVLGTKNPKRLKDLCKALNIELSREHWYLLLESILGKEIP